MDVASHFDVRSTSEFQGVSPSQDTLAQDLVALRSLASGPVLGGLCSSNVVSAGLVDKLINFAAKEVAKCCKLLGGAEAAKRVQAAVLQA